MPPLDSSIFGLVAVALLVVINGFFVAVEFAIVRSHVTKFHDVELIKQFGTRSALKLIKDLDLSLSATQLGITVVSLVLGWYGESIFAEIFLYLFDTFNQYYFGNGTSISVHQSVISHGIATTLALCLVTFCHVVVGEQAAKNLAIRHPEETLRYLAPFMLMLCQICRPIIFLLNECANLFLRLFGIKVDRSDERVHTSSELSMLIAASTRSGELDKDEEQMLQGVFQFSETVAREIMTPRLDVVWVPASASFEEMYNIIVQSGLSRFPVIGDKIDDVKGVLLSRDVLRVAPRYFSDTTVHFDVSSLLRECYFIPGTKSINDLLSELKKRKVHMAIVLDEHGGFDGVVTLEDIIEEIVGDIFDESDGAKLDIVHQENGDILVDGGVLVTDLSNAFNIPIPVGDYDTIAGFIFDSLGRIAKLGDKVCLNRFGETSVNGGPYELPKGAEPLGNRDPESDGEGEECLYEFIVEKISGNRIETVVFKNKSSNKLEINETEINEIQTDNDNDQN